MIKFICTLFQSLPGDTQIDNNALIMYMMPH